MDLSNSDGCYGGSRWDIAGKIAEKGKGEYSSKQYGEEEWESGEGDRGDSIKEAARVEGYSEWA